MSCRGYDYVARMGGDEFVITAPGLTADAAKEKAERLNQAAIESGRHVCGRDVITLSVGMAFCPEDGFDVERLLAEADRRMYSMKQLHHAQQRARADNKLSAQRRNRRPRPCSPELRANEWRGKLHGMGSPWSRLCCWEDCFRQLWCGSRRALMWMKPSSILI